LPHAVIKPLVSGFLPLQPVWSFLELADEFEELANILLGDVWVIDLLHVVYVPFFLASCD
jgi:hypothetical protein